MRSFYCISAKEPGGGRAYTGSRAGARYLADLARTNGFTPVITRLTKMDVPMQDVELVAEL